MSETEDLERLFYGGVSDDQIPEDVLQKVLQKSFRMWEFIDTISLATPMYNGRLLTYSEYYEFSNDRLPLDERKNKLLYKVLPSKGNQRKTLSKFYSCLLECKIPPEIPRKLREYALQECKVDRPILSFEDDTAATSDMVARLMGEPISQDAVTDLVKDLELTDTKLDDLPEGNLGALFQTWVSTNPNASTPVRVVKALVCTKSLGRFASGLALPCNPPDVRSFFYNLGEKWRSLAYFLGYTTDELQAITANSSTCQQQIASFLNMFEMPECGTQTLPILHKAAQKAGVSSPRHRVSTLDPTDRPELKRKHAKGRRTLESCDPTVLNQAAAHRPQEAKVRCSKNRLHICVEFTSPNQQPATSHLHPTISVKKNGRPVSTETETETEMETESDSGSMANTNSSVSSLPINSIKPKETNEVLSESSMGDVHDQLSSRELDNQNSDQTSDFSRDIPVDKNKQDENINPRIINIEGFTKRYIFTKLDSDSVYKQLLLQKDDIVNIKSPHTIGLIPILFPFILAFVQNLRQRIEELQNENSTLRVQLLTQRDQPRENVTQLQDTSGPVEVSTYQQQPSPLLPISNSTLSEGGRSIPEQTAQGNESRLYRLCLYSPINPIPLHELRIVVVSISGSDESIEKLSRKLANQYRLRFETDPRSVRFIDFKAEIKIISLSPDEFSATPKQSPAEILREEVDRITAEQIPPYITFQIQNQGVTVLRQDINICLAVFGLDRRYEYRPVLVTASLGPSRQLKSAEITLLAQHLQHRWRDLGRQLRLEERELNHIGAKYPDDISRCKSVIKKWNQNRNVSLTDAVRNVDETGTVAALLHKMM